MKKMFSLALALIMALALCVPAFAADANAEIDITITSTDVNKTGATYYAYKLLDLTTAVKCGQDHDHEETCYAYSYKLNAEFDDVMLAVTNTTAAEEHKSLDQTVMDKLITMDGRTLAEDIFDNYIKNGSYDHVELTEGTSANLKQGYWLIVDKTALENGEVGSLVMLDTAGQESLIITAKDDTMSLDKAVSDDGEDFGEYVDVNTDDYVWFKLTSGQLPHLLAEYQGYTFVINDAMDTSLDYEGELTVKIGDTEIAANDYTATGFFAADATAKNGVATIDLSAYIIANKSTLADQVVTITYKAKLNKTAEMGNPGNANVAYLTYTDDPSVPDTGRTTDDTVVVFTYELDVTKVAKENNALLLPGAEFKLYRMNGADKEYVVVADGIVSDWDATGTTFVTDANGEFYIAGLDVGSYWLTETKAPEGYNLLADDVKVEIDADYNDSADKTVISELKIQVNDETAAADGAEVWESGDATEGTVAVTVENSNGAELPSTGGVGTTIFYVIGGVLMAGAAVLLVTKKKLANEQ